MALKSLLLLKASGVSAYLKWFVVWLKYKAVDFNKKILIPQNSTVKIFQYDDCV